jgi:hypothetical protein
MTPSSGASALLWGRGDTYTLFIAIAFFLVGCAIHWRALWAQGTNCADMVGGLMSTSLTFGPLLMILLDPINKYVQLVDGDLLGIVMRDARITLWFASFLALVNLTISFLRPRLA